MNKIIFKKVRNIICLHIVGKNKMRRKGKNNFININDSSYIRNTHIIIRGNNNTVIIGNNCNIFGLRILITENDNVIEIGSEVTINASTFQPTVVNALGGESIQIGEGSLLSNNIEIHTTDYHGIYDVNGKRVNSDKSILIGKHVWIGLGVKILKGTEIADGCVIGAGSVLSGLYQSENVIIAGNPAKIIKEHIFWKKERRDNFAVPNILKR